MHRRDRIACPPPPLGELRFHSFFRVRKHITTNSLKKVRFKNTHKKRIPKVPLWGSQKQTQIHTKSSQNRLRAAVDAHRRHLWGGGLKYTEHLQETARNLKKFWRSMDTRSHSKTRQKQKWWTFRPVFIAFWGTSQQAEYRPRRPQNKIVIWEKTKSPCGSVHP